MGCDYAIIIIIILYKFGVLPEDFWVPTEAFIIIDNYTVNILYALNLLINSIYSIFQHFNIYELGFMYKIYWSAGVLGCDYA